MAGRQNKVDLDYFELDCRMDDKIKLIQAEFGLKGFALVVMLWQHIYGGEHGYYCEWDDERLLLFMSHNGLIGESKNLINEIILACIRREIFSEKLYKEYGILTSSGVQKQYLKATVKREVVNLKKEYLLISVPINMKNVVINSISSDINSISDGRNEHSKVKKSKEENIPPISPVTSLDEFISAYPLPDREINRHLTEIAYVDCLMTRKVTEAELLTAAKNYADKLKRMGKDGEQDSRFVKRPENFLNGLEYCQYLPGIYVPPKPKEKKGANSGMMRQDYGDMSELEKEILSN